MVAGEESDRWWRVKELFSEVADLGPDERRSILELRCGDDHGLMREVLDLVACDDAATGPPPSLRVSGGGLADGDRVGPWRVVRFLAHGGMGRVYLAERADGAYEQRVALKVIRGEYTEHSLARFAAERRTLARLEHANIARLLDGGTTADGAPYLAIEYVEGDPIDVYCQRHKLPVFARLRLFAEVCAAVGYAHRNLIVHRDLKPQNILVTAEGHPKLLDFGISKQLAEGQDGLTLTGARLMTPRYASPEQVLGGRVTTATDVYSIGVMLYECVTGRRPYHPESGHHTLERAICDETPPRPSTAVLRPPRSEDEEAATLSVRGARSLRRLSRYLSGDLDVVVMCALQKDESRRYRSADDLGDDLMHVIERRPVSARGDSLSYRLLRFAQRHKVAAALLIALLVSVIAGVMNTALWAKRAARAAQTAEDRAERYGAVTSFLVGMLTAPGEQLDHDAPLSAYLDVAAARLAREGESDPRVASEVHHALGVSYTVAGRYDAALTHLDRAVDLAVADAEGTELLADTLLARSELQVHLGDHDAAERDARESVRCLEQIDPHHPRRLQALVGVAMARSFAGDAIETERLCRQALAIDEDECDPSARAEVQALLASTLQVTGRSFDEALDLIDAAIESANRLHGPEGLIAMNRRRVRLSILVDLGEFQQVRDEAARELAQARARFTDGNVALASYLDVLAKAWAQGEGADLERAEALFREALEIERASFGDDHPNIAHRLSSIGMLLSVNGRVAEALDYFREAADRLRRHFGDEDRMTVAVADLNVGILEVQVGELESARERLAETYRVLVRLAGPSHEHAVQAARWIGGAWWQEGDCDHAIDAMLMALSPFVDRTPATRDALQVCGDVTGIMADCNRAGDARDLLARVRGATVAASGEDHPAVEEIDRMMRDLTE